VIGEAKWGRGLRLYEADASSCSFAIDLSSKIGIAQIQVLLL
jgi:hypothetical protein